MELISQNGKFPDSLPWGFIENRHIIRILFNFAALLWLDGKKSDALPIFQSILKSNPMDNIGARYAIVAILDGFKSLYEFEDKFGTEDGYIDWESQGKWFFKASQKYTDVIGWWLELEDE